MQGISKTLTEMTLVERSTLLETVAAALEASADEAEEEGDARVVTNLTCVANTIRGISGNVRSQDLKVAERLLEQGITLVHQFSNRHRVSTFH